MTSLAHALAAHLQEEWPQCPSVQQLQKNLGQERAAVFTFMYSTCDEVRAGPAACHCLLHPLCGGVVRPSLAEPQHVVACEASCAAVVTMHCQLPDLACCTCSGPGENERKNERTSK